MKRNSHGKITLLNKFLSYKWVKNESIFLLFLQILYIIIGSYLKIKRLYFIDIIVMMSFSLILLILFYIFIIIQSRKSINIIHKIGYRFHKMLNIVSKRIFSSYIINYILLCIFLLKDTEFPMTINIICYSFITLSLFLVNIFNCRLFIYEMKNKCKSINVKKGHPHNHFNLTILLIILFGLVFIGYCIFIILRQGRNQQIGFVNTIIGFIFTLCLTNYYTNLKLRGSRENELRDSLYIDDHKFIRKTVSKIIYLTALADKLNIMTRHVENYDYKNQDTFLNDQKQMSNAFQQMSIRYNKLGLYYLCYLKQNYKSLSTLFSNFIQDANNFVDYYNITYLNNESIHTMRLTNLRIQKINSCTYNMMKKLISIDNKYKKEIKEGKF